MNQLIEQLSKKLSSQVIETHISWVLINNLVYKIKKAVNYGFLDFTTLEKRKFYCEQEVILNKRLCDDLYLGVVPIKFYNGEYSIDEEGEIIEYAVAMKKLPQSQMMDLLLERNQFEFDDIDNLSQIIANFHQNAQTNDYILSFGNPLTIKISTDENFDQTKLALDKFLTKHQYEAIKDYTNEFFDKFYLRQRLKLEKIKDCHGDLYSKNICFADKIYVYDCIEFNERFRYIDTASDVAFLLMDLEYHNRYDLSRFFLEKYIEYANDTTILSVINFYKVYRAYVRGKIAFFQNNQEEANKYFDLAYSYIDTKRKPKAIALSGLTGCGKSYFAFNLAKEINANVYNSDEIRKNLFKPTKQNYDIGEGIYENSKSKIVYDTLSQLAINDLKNGKNVILDATYLKETHRQELANKLKILGIEPLFIFLDIDEPTILKNLKKRLSQASISDGNVNVYYHQKAVFEKPKNAITIHSNDGSALEHVLEFLKKEGYNEVRS